MITGLEARQSAMYLDDHAALARYLFGLRDDPRM
jgi:hypothetical protein